jgi:DNA polymerase/3'-5' exonuclease PolX
LADISAYPRLDPKRVMRVYKKLNIGSVDELRAELENGAIEKALGAGMAQHIRQGLMETHAMLSTAPMIFVMRLRLTSWDRAGQRGRNP